MDREQTQEWLELRAQAKSIVQRGEKIEPKRGVGTKRLFQIVKFPSFASTVGREVFHQHDASLGTECFFGVRKERMFSEDIKKLENPVARLAWPGTISPTIQTAKIELNHTFAAKIRRELESISIPAFFHTTNFGTDGTSWEFSSGDCWAGLCLFWWESLPGPSKRVSDIIQSSFEELEKVGGS